LTVAVTSFAASYIQYDTAFSKRGTQVINPTFKKSSIFFLHCPVSHIKRHLYEY